MKINARKIRSLSAILIVSLGFCSLAVPMQAADEPEKKKEGFLSKIFGKEDATEPTATGDATAVAMARKKSPPVGTGSLGFGAPAADRRFAAAVRGPGMKGKTPTLAIIAPQGPGYTGRSQPSFSWYQSFPTASGSLVFNVYDSSWQPVWGGKKGKTLSTSYKAGFHEVNLGKLGASLVPGKTYTWSITHVVDSNTRSVNLVAQGTIAYSKSAPKEGYFYDAFAAGSPQQRSNMIKEAGLSKLVAGQ